MVEKSQKSGRTVISKKQLFQHAISSPFGQKLIQRLINRLSRMILTHQNLLDESLFCFAEIRTFPVYKSGYIIDNRPLCGQIIAFKSILLRFHRFLAENHSRQHLIVRAFKPLAPHRFPGFVIRLQASEIGQKFTSHIAAVHEKIVRSLADEVPVIFNIGFLTRLQRDFLLFYYTVFFIQQMIRDVRASIPFTKLQNTFPFLAVLKIADSYIFQPGKTQFVRLSIILNLWRQTLKINFFQICTSAENAPSQRDAHV